MWSKKVPTKTNFCKIQLQKWDDLFCQDVDNAVGLRTNLYFFWFPFDFPSLPLPPSNHPSVSAKFKSASSPTSKNAGPLFQVMLQYVRHKSTKMARFVSNNKLVRSSKTVQASAAVSAWLEGEVWHEQSLKACARMLPPIDYSICFTSFLSSLKHFREH